MEEPLTGTALISSREVPDVPIDPCGGCCRRDRDALRNAVRCRKRHARLAARQRASAHGSV
jgi:hypothetical protein